MMRILLVDDEVAICNGMKKLIEKTDAECFVVAEAYDGIEALDMMEQFHPDVILTDMRMPRMDGLELLEEAKKRNPELLTAVLSAYSDYEYIRKAMFLHASDYLLKPATTKDMKELLQKLKQKHEQSAISKEQMTLSSLLQGAAIERYPASLQYAHYALLLLCAGPTIHGVIDVCPGEALWQSSLFEENSESCKAHDVRQWLLNGERSNEKLILLATNQSDPETSFRLAVEGYRQSLAQQTLPVTIAVQLEFSLHHLYATSKQLRRELLHALVFAKSSVLYLTRNPIRESDGERRFTAETATVMETVRQNQYESFVTALHKLIMSWERNQASQYAIQQTLFRILSEFGEGGLERQIEMEALITRSTSYSELYAHVTNLFQALFESMNAAVRKPRAGTIVGQVEQYLIMNFREPISLSSLSEKFRLVPNYLSVLFKKEIGVTPLEYLMEYRINQAKRILDERPYLLLKQVASNVGYPDQLYFSRVFKKMTGQSPSEYVQSRPK